MSLTASQPRGLHTLWRPFARPARIADGREARIAWASATIGRHVPSFSELQAAEAAQLIDEMKRALGQEVKPAIPRRPGRRTAHACGTAGRRGRADKEILLVDEET